METIPVINLKALDKPEMRINAPNKVKLMPIKNHSAIVDSKKNREFLEQKKQNLTADHANNIKVIEEEDLNSSEIKELIKTSISSKRNKRYSSQNKINSSFAGSDFRLIDDNCEVNLYDQINKSIMKIDEDENGVAYIEGTNGKRISIFGLKSPVINAKKEHCNDSQDRATYQGSTICSNTMNKSSKKSGFKLSYDFCFS
jgi:activator of HSP90 ATPase